MIKQGNVASIMQGEACRITTSAEISDISLQKWLFFVNFSCLLLSKMFKYC